MSTWKTATSYTFRYTTEHSINESSFSFLKPSLSPFYKLAPPPSLSLFLSDWTLLNNIDRFDIFDLGWPQPWPDLVLYYSYRTTRVWTGLGSMRLYRVWRSSRPFPCHPMTLDLKGATISIWPWQFMRPSSPLLTFMCTAPTGWSTKQTWSFRSRWGNLVKIFIESWSEICMYQRNCASSWQWCCCYIISDDLTFTGIIIN